MGFFSWCWWFSVLGMSFRWSIGIGRRTRLCRPAVTTSSCRWKASCVPTWEKSWRSSSLSLTVKKIDPSGKSWMEIRAEFFFMLVCWIFVLGKLENTRSYTCLLLGLVLSSVEVYNFLSCPLSGCSRDTGMTHAEFFGKLERTVKSQSLMLDRSMLFTSVICSSHLALIIYLVLTV